MNLMMRFACIFLLEHRFIYFRTGGHKQWPLGLVFINKEHAHLHTVHGNCNRDFMAC